MQRAVLLLRLARNVRKEGPSRVSAQGIGLAKKLFLSISGKKLYLCKVVGANAVRGQEGAASAPQKCINR